MNVAILLLTGRFLRRQVSLMRVCLAAAVGGMWACLSAVMNWEYGIVHWILQGIHWFVLPVVMIGIAYPDRQWREVLRGCICLYLSAILLGGLIHAIWENTALGRFWQVWMAGSDTEAISVWLLALAMLGGLTAIGVGRRYRIASNRREQIQEVILYAGDRQWTVKALWDSGNQLQDPCFGKAVHIVEAKEVKQLLGDGAYQYLMGYMEQGIIKGETMADPEKEVDPDPPVNLQDTPWIGQQAEHLELPRIHLVPCRSLGSAHTLIPVFSIDKMRLANGTLLMEPLIGLSRVALSEDGSYGMLLHSQTDEMRRNQ